MKLKIIVYYDDSFTEKEKAKHITAMALAEIAINSVEFRDAVLSHRFTSTKMGSQAIYNLIMSGKDKFDPSPDHEIDVDPTLYYKNNSTVGYTYPSTVRTWINKKFFATYSYASIAGNAIHEAIHNKGFGHSSAKDHGSVPYFVGYLVRDLVKRLVRGENLTPIDGLYIPRIGAQEVQNTTLPATPRQKVVCYRSWRTLWFKRCHKRDV